jgi:hypothetical protein
LLTSDQAHELNGLAANLEWDRPVTHIRLRSIRRSRIIVTRQPPGDVVCHGTVFVGDRRLPPLDMRGYVLPDAPQLTVPDLDVSFVTDCYRYVVDSHSGGRALLPGSPPLERLTAVRWRVWVFSEHFCRLLGALSEEQGALISRNWYTPEESSLAAQSEAQVLSRTGMLFALSRLARAVTGDHTSLFLKVEYRSRLSHAVASGNA